MYTTEDYEFRKDVYTSLIRIAGFLVSGFLSGEQKDCENDFLFYTSHLDSTDEIISRALRKGKLVGANTEVFLGSFRKVVNDDFARQAFLHQVELTSLSTQMFDSISTEAPHLKNAFNRYWKSYCSKSVKMMYYRYLITDSASPKYVGLGPAGSRRLYGIILNFMGEVKDYLNRYISPSTEPFSLSNPMLDGEYTPAPGTAPEPVVQKDDILFLSYVYDYVVSIRYPASAMRLNVLRRRLSADEVFFKKVLAMDQADIRKEMGIVDFYAKEIAHFCDTMRRIVNHPGTYNVFSHPERAILALPIIEERIKTEHIRVYHAYQKFLESCHGSIVDFYLKVVGINRETVKFDGLNQSKSKELLDIFIGLLPEVDSFVRCDDSSPEMKYRPLLTKLNVPTERQDLIIEIARKSGHFPFFTLLKWDLDSLSKERGKTIYSKALNLYYGHTVEDLNAVSVAMGLSRERVRQLREECCKFALNLPEIFNPLNLIGDYKYDVKSDYDFNHIREEEQVEFSNEYLIICISIITPDLRIIGDVRKALINPSGASEPLYLVSRRTAEVFEYSEFVTAIENLRKEKRFYPYRDDLEPFVRGMIRKPVSDEDFYDILRECRQILQKGYPDNIINSQIYFPANARKVIPLLIEDILREFNRQMTAEEISDLLNERYPDIDQIPSKIGANALRNPNIVAVGRSSTYALTEWNATDKRGGTIRDLAIEYLNSLIKPIAPLTDLCEYISKFREDVKESSIKANLLAETSNRFSIYYKEDVLHIGYTDVYFGEEYRRVEERQGRRPFKDSIARLEQFIKANDRFPFTSGVDGEEVRLSRFYAVSKANQRKGVLEPDELAELERIDETYGHLKVKKERISWDERLERFVKYITDNESLPYPSSKESAWYQENKALYDAGELDSAHRQSFAFLVKIVERMNNPLNL